MSYQRKASPRKRCRSFASLSAQPSPESRPGEARAAIRGCCGSFTAKFDRPGPPIIQYGARTPPTPRTTGGRQGSSARLALMWNTLCRSPSVEPLTAHCLELKTSLPWEMAPPRLPALQLGLFSAFLPVPVCPEAESNSENRVGIWCFQILSADRQAIEEAPSSNSLENGSSLPMGRRRSRSPDPGQAQIGAGGYPRLQTVSSAAVVSAPGRCHKHIQDQQECLLLPTSRASFFDPPGAIQAVDAGYR